MVGDFQPGEEGNSNNERPHCGPMFRQGKEREQQGDNEAGKDWVMKEAVH